MEGLLLKGGLYSSREAGNPSFSDEVGREGIRNVVEYGMST